MEKNILAKSLLIWVTTLILGILNGGLRNFFLTPLIDEKYSIPISGLSLCCLIFIISLILIPLLGKGVKKTYIQMGILWVLLTVIFETVMGFIQRAGFKEIIDQYNITTGNLWLIVILFIAFVPLIVAKIKQII